MDVLFFCWGVIIENDLRLGDFFSDSDICFIYLKEVEVFYWILSVIR